MTTAIVVLAVIALAVAVLTRVLNPLVAARMARRQLPGTAQAPSEPAAANPSLAAQLEEASRLAARRESLFRAVVSAVPTAIVLVDASGTLLLANEAARELLFDGRDAVGESLFAYVARAPEAFREALASDDAVFSVEVDGDTETYLLSKRAVDPDGEALTLITLRPVTREIRRRELSVLKTLLRVMNHELNNSLAPISSMAHSGRLIARTPDQLHRLDAVFQTIEERAKHLQGFLESYARFARLPPPRRAPVLWKDLLARIEPAWPGVRVSAVEGVGEVDDAQIEQLVFNLLKNATEASGGRSDGIELLVEASSEGWDLIVRDRGAGMTDEVLRRALTPFYSTKRHGSGLGLALCREIVEAHGGRLRLHNRQGGGLEVVCSLPDADRPVPSHRVRSFVSRA
jgi:two-component system, NtrC family, nitrogen regulation sensor histidine kinase NtrY